MSGAQTQVRALDRIADRLRTTVPDGYHVGAVWPDEPSPGWNVTTLRVYRHGQDAVNILCYQEPGPELLRAIGEAFRGE